MSRHLAALATVAMLALGAAACGHDDQSGGAAVSAPEPVAQIDSLSGRQTEVALDGAFVEALGTLQLTPAPVGDGKLSRAESRASPSPAAA